MARRHPCHAGAREVLTKQPQGALISRVVEQVTGVLAQHSGLGLDEAFDRIRGYTRTRSLRLAEVAHQLVPPSLDLDELPAPARVAARSVRAARGRAFVRVTWVALPRTPATMLGCPPEGFAVSVRGVQHGAGMPAADTIAGNGHAPLCSWLAESLPLAVGELVVLRVAGELDLLGYPTLRTALARIVAAAPSHLLVDLSAVTFCGARGFVLLADAGADAVAGGTAYAISGLPVRFDKIVSLLWDDGGPRRYGTEATAVTLIRAGAARVR